jgi:hypothetical protein
MVMAFLASFNVVRWGGKELKKYNRTFLATAIKPLPRDGVAVFFTPSC